MVSTEHLMSLRNKIRQHYLADEAGVVRQLIDSAGLSRDTREQISKTATSLVEALRSDTTPTMMELFLGEYGLSTKEGVALMCLAEALLRVPDAVTIDALIEDKISTGQWGGHQGKSGSTLVNASTWALMLTGKVLLPTEEKNMVSSLKNLVKRLGEPVVRTAVGQAMREMGRQFVLGRTIEEATKRSSRMEEKGYSYSFDMLGEAARTETDARYYHLAYSAAIADLSAKCRSDEINENPGISVKLSALFPRYEYGQRDRVLSELVPRVHSLALLAKSAGMGFNIDAEEADRLDLSLDVIEAVLGDPALVGWDGFGIAVQAFGLRASHLLDWLYALARKLDRKITVRLTKGAYWDTEIKRAQVLGISGFPVFTRKVNTDVSYVACARKLLGMTDRIYPQFATHNAHSVAAILEMADDKRGFEFQRLHGMGENLYDIVLKREAVNCRIYAPVGEHRDLLAYLVRRLLENGANSSFVNQTVDKSISAKEIARDPFTAVESLGDEIANKRITKPAAIFGSDRKNAKGWDVTDPLTVEQINNGRKRFAQRLWHAGPIISGVVEGGDLIEKYNPARPDEMVGEILQATLGDVETAITAAFSGFRSWAATPAADRAEILRSVADLYETHADEMFALAAREAGKTVLDGVGEVREAVDFARYYANEAERVGRSGEARGIITCISPWNFPLAIFSGQILAALAAGNVVLAKPAEQTSLIAARAVALMHQAGVPESALQLLPGPGAVVGDALTRDPRIAGVCFTGSTITARCINRVMADDLSPDAPLIAETGGLNAMIMDSTALPEQAVRDILASAFQSAGQRCSALRMLYIQKDVAEHTLDMLKGAMDELQLGDPWQLSTDVGPIIDEAARAKIDDHVAKFQARGCLIKKLALPDGGNFVSPAVISLSGIEELDEEIFGPVLHVATFEADEIDAVVDAINDKGFGLTFGLHTRVNTRVEQIVERIKVGNIYVNRNQIGAVVGSQPFGGEGLSGTGPKAGGSHYVQRFRKRTGSACVTAEEGEAISLAKLQSRIDQLANTGWMRSAEWMDTLTACFNGQQDLLNQIEVIQQMPDELPGPTGESNHPSIHPRGTVLCLGPDPSNIHRQLLQSLAMGNRAVVAAVDAENVVEQLGVTGWPVAAVDGTVSPASLADINGIDAIASGANQNILKSYRQALAKREGALIPLISEQIAPERYALERHLCVDTTAAGGNASLLFLD